MCVVSCVGMCVVMSFVIDLSRCSCVFDMALCMYVCLHCCVCMYVFLYSLVVCAFVLYMCRAFALSHVRYVCGTA